MTIPAIERISSHTGASSPDTMGLGRTSGQRSAEIIAAARAESMPTPVTMALSRMMGRIMVRMMRAVTSEATNSVMNFMPVRTGGITGLVTASVPPGKTKLLLVDVAAGFSPRGIEMAADLPEAEVIEIDLPDVIEEKYRRLNRARSVRIPENLKWKKADLAHTSLAKILDERKADAISAEGLTPYFLREDNIRIGQQMLDNLLPGGVFVFDMAWTVGIRRMEEASKMFNRQAGNFIGAVDTPEQVVEMYREAGFVSVDVFLPSEVAARFDLPQPVMDLQLLAVARKGL